MSTYCQPVSLCYQSLFSPQKITTLIVLLPRTTRSKKEAIYCSTTPDWPARSALEINELDFQGEYESHWGAWYHALAHVLLDMGESYEGLITCDEIKDYDLILKRVEAKTWKSFEIIKTRDDEKVVIVKNGGKFISLEEIKELFEGVIEIHFGHFFS